MFKVHFWVSWESGKFGLKKGTGVDPPPPGAGNVPFFYRFFYRRASLRRHSHFWHLHNIIKISSRFIEPIKDSVERHENFRSSKREGQWRAYRKKWRRYICHKKMREIKRLFKSWNQFQNEIDTLVPKLMGINSHQKTYLRSKVFMPCSVELWFWKKITTMHIFPY